MRDSVGLLELFKGHLAARYLRSLFAIYDPVDLMRLDLPWWTFAAIQEVESLIASWEGEVRVFEYGCGSSTAWLGKRCAIVRCVEHNVAFANEMKWHVEALDKVRIHCVPPRPVARGTTPQAPSRRRGMEDMDFADYVRDIRRWNMTFDLIVIDSRARAACLEEALGYLTARGVILFDNSNRKEYQAALAGSGLHRRVFAGLTPSLPYRDETSILAPPASTVSTRPDAEGTAATHLAAGKRSVLRPGAAVSIHE